MDKNKLIMNCVKFCKMEGKTGEPRISLHRVMERVCAILGLSRPTVYRCIRQNDPALCAMDKTKKSERKRRGPESKYDSFQMSLIRRVAHGAMEKKEFLSVCKLKTLLSRNHDCEIPRSTLWKCLKLMGFKYGKRGKDVILMESNHIVAKRHSYLRQVKKIREEGTHKLVFVDETWVNSAHTPQKEWQTEDGVYRSGLPKGKGGRVIVLDAGTQEGFLPGASKIFNSNASSDYHEEMNGDTFKHWFENVCKNLQGAHAFVVDNASYHSVVCEESKAPTNAWNKNAILTWLEGRNIPSDARMKKSELMQIVKLHKPPVKYVIDEIALKYGHVVLRLPPYHSELNPIEEVWAFMKNFVARNNVKFTLTHVRELFLIAREKAAEEGIWGKVVKRVEEREREMWRADGLTDELRKMVIVLDDEDTEDDEDESSDEEAEEQPGGSDRECTMEYIDEETAGEEEKCARCKRAFPPHDDTPMWEDCDYCGKWLHLDCWPQKWKYDKNGRQGYWCDSCQNKLQLEL